jgi:precorrin-4 methylase
MQRFLGLSVLTLILSTLCVHAADPAVAVHPAQSPALRSLVVRNPAGQTISLTPAQFAELPRTKVRETVPHSDQKAVYEGVLLRDVLRAAGAPLEQADAPGRLSAELRTAYVLIEAADGYQVVFSAAELHTAFGGREVLLADRLNGAPLPDKAAPYQVIVPGTELHSRWIRQVTRILVQPGTASPFASSDASQPVAERPEGSRGRIYLVGVGPGDLDLISVRAARLLRQADAVFCFSWMKDEIADLVQPGVVEVASPLLRGGGYCDVNPDDVSGELRERVVQTNEEFAKLRSRLEELVASGKTVVFADNGDPMLFSPWSWITRHLADMQPVVVPGISSFNAANALLQQGMSGNESIILSGGNEIGTADENGRPRSTLVLFTHRAKLDELLPRLRAIYAPDTPLAIVGDVTYPGERMIRATLGTIQDRLAGEELPQLYLMYVGGDPPSEAPRR